MNAELKLQADCNIWRTGDLRARILRPYVFRIKNELDNHGHKDLKSKIIQLNENKTTGVKRGIWDELVMIGPTIWIEYKIGRNWLTPEQEDFMNIGLELGHEFRIAKNINQYKEIIYAIIDEYC